MWEVSKSNARMCGPRELVKPAICFVVRSYVILHHLPTMDSYYRCVDHRILSPDLVIIIIIKHLTLL